MKFLRRIIITFFVFSLSLWISFASSGFIGKLNIFENYLENQKVNIKKFYSIYWIDRSENINDVLIETDKIITNIKRIKKTNPNDKEKEIILKVIADKISVLSKNTKKHIKREVENYEEDLKEKKHYYNKVAKKITKSIEKINLNVYNKKIKNKDFSLKKQKITNNLINLKKITKKLENFRKIDFKNKNQMKKTFLNILLEIKNEIINLKQNLKNI